MSPESIRPASMPAPAGARRWRVWAIVSVGVFMASLDLFIVNIAFPDIERDFTGSSLSDLSWVLNAYAIVFAALLVPAGRISDRAGRKRGFLFGLALFTTASAFCAVAPSTAVLVGARVLQAAGAAFLVPTSLGLLLPEFPPAQRATAVGAWAAVGGVAAAAGPPVGGLLVEASWRWVFLVNVPVGLVTLAIAARALREYREEKGAPLPDLLGAAMLAAGIASLALGIVKGPDWGWADTRVLGAFAAAATLVPLFVWRSAHHRSPVVELEMLRVRSFALANVGSFLFFAGFSAMLLAGVLFLTGVWDYSVLHAGLLLVPGPFFAALFSFPAGKLGDRFGQRAVGVPGTLLFALGNAWWVWRVGPDRAYAGEMLPGLIVSGIGVGLTIPSLSSAAAASLPPHRFATGIAVFGMSRQIGAALGVAILIAILGTPDPGDPVGAFSDGWTFIALVSVGAALAAAALGRVQVVGAAPSPESNGHAPLPERSRLVTWQDPVAAAERRHDLSGIDHLRAIRDGQVPPPPIAKLLDMSIVEIEEGRATFAVNPDEFHYNPIGVVHGGLAATLLDSAMGCAVQSKLPAGTAYTTLELKVNFVRPMTRETGRVVCEAQIVHAGSRVATAEGRVFVEETGKLIAHGTTTCMVLSANGAGSQTATEETPRATP